jgi:hypothetical protein
MKVEEVDAKVLGGGVASVADRWDFHLPKAKAWRLEAVRGRKYLF